MPIITHFCYRNVCGSVQTNPDHVTVQTHPLLPISLWWLMRHSMIIPSPTCTYCWLHFLNSSHCSFNSGHTDTLLFFQLPAQDSPLVSLPRLLFPLGIHLSHSAPESLCTMLPSQKDLTALPKANLGFLHSLSYIIITNIIICYYYMLFMTQSKFAQLLLFCLSCPSTGAYFIG